eukprot:SM000163S02327  [mRNA]  locus=s163:227464:241100:+ [translate_table: standard]
MPKTPKPSHPVLMALHRAWDDHDLISLEPEASSHFAPGNHGGPCFSSAIVKSIAQYAGRRSTSVRAMDATTGVVLQCQVSVDTPAQLRIFHHSTKIDLGSFASLQALAFDSEDNVFSSLVGVQFLWELYPADPLGVKEDRHRLEQMPLRDTPLHLRSELTSELDLEDSALRSDLLVVRGVAAGLERVTVRIVEPSLKDLQDSISLTVAEAFFLEPPSPIFLMPGGIFHLVLKVLGQGRATEVRLPTAHYRFSSINESIAHIDARTGHVFGYSPGSATVMAEDMRVQGHTQLCVINVVTPVSLQLSLAALQDSKQATTFAASSDTPWQVVVGRSYVVTVLSFSKESGSRPLMLTKHDDLTLKLANEAVWEALPIPENVAATQGWQNATVLRPVAPGVGTLLAWLMYRSLRFDTTAGQWMKEDEKVLRVEQSVVACHQVHLRATTSSATTAQVIRLPWVPGILQTFTLTARGGCGVSAQDFLWSSQNASVAIVVADGIIKVQGVGRTLITATATHDPLNFASVPIEVSIPGKLEPARDLQWATALGNLLPIAVTALDPSGNSYSNCNGLVSLVRWRLKDDMPSFQLLDQLPPGAPDSISKVVGLEACAHAILRAVETGRTSVVASLDVAQLAGRQPPASLPLPAQLEATWTVASYPPLNLELAGEGITRKEIPYSSELRVTMALGSSAEVLVKGGPERWLGRKYTDTFSILDTTDGARGRVVSVNPGGNQLRQSYLVTCTGVGTSVVTFVRGVTCGSASSMVMANLTSICTAPSDLLLLLHDAELEAKPAEEAVKKTVMTVTTASRFELEALALDDDGQPFANASTLALSWSLEKCEGRAHLEDVVGSAWRRRIVLQQQEGPCTVKAQLKGVDYSSLPAHIDSDVQRSFLRLLESKGDRSAASVTLQIVSALRLEPRLMVLYYHPDNQGKLQIIGGTLDVRPSVTNSTVVKIAHVKPSVGNRSLELTLSVSALGAAEVHARDRGLIPEAEAAATVVVSEVAWIRLLLPDDPSLQVGAVMNVEMQAGDSSGRKFDHSQFTLMNLTVHVQEDVVEVIGIGNSMGNIHQTSAGPATSNSFWIRGQAPGIASSLQVTLLQPSGRKVISEPVRILVYSPLAIQPPVLVVAPGADYQMTVSGGPSTGSRLRFLSSDEVTATVDPITGLLQALKEGYSVVYARAEGADGSILSEAEAPIRVHKPQNISLETRGGRLGVGKTMSTFPGENLLSFGPLCYKCSWSVTDSKVIEIWSRGEGGGSCAAIVLGRSAGRTRISLTAQCTILRGHESIEAHFTTSEVLWVVPDPPLTMPTTATWLLPLRHGSAPLLPAKGGTVSYSVLQDPANVDAVTLVEKYKIRTSEFPGVGCLFAREPSTGRGEMAICIRTAEISQMLVGQDGMHERLAELPIGTSQQYRISFQDDIGHPFYEVGKGSAQISVENNHRDVVAADVIQEGTELLLVVQTKKQGSAWLRIGLAGNPRVHDFLMVQVGTYICPTSPVLVLDSCVNFTLSGGKGPSTRSVEAGMGMWTSSEQSVLKVDKDSGRTCGVGPGKARVAFHGPGLSTHADVEVVKLAAASISPPAAALLSNDLSSLRGYKFPVNFWDVSHNNLTGEIDFSCNVHPPYLGEVKAHWDQASGEHFCHFQPKSPEALWAAALYSDLAECGSLPDGGAIPLNVSATVPGPLITAGPAVAHFLGEFAVLNRTELMLSDVANESVVRVVGNVVDVGATWAHHDRIDIKKVLVSACEVHFQLKLRASGPAFLDRLQFSSPGRGFEEEVPIHYLGYQEHNQAGRSFIQFIIQKARLNQLSLAATSSAGSFGATLGLLTTATCILLSRLIGRWRTSSTASTRLRNSEPTSPPFPSTPKFADSGRERSGSPYSQTIIPPKPYTEYIVRTLETTPQLAGDLFNRSTTGLAMGMSLFLKKTTASLYFSAPKIAVGATKETT